ncbi:MAG: COX15/CtaA family protein [Halobacteriota archaeon]
MEGPKQRLDGLAESLGGKVPYVYLLVVTLVFTYVTMVLGSYTSSIGAGLSCPDWPQCYGVWFPFSNPEAMYDHPDFPGYAEAYTSTQIFAEWIHRGVAGVTGFLVLGSAAGAWLGRRKPAAVRYSTLAALLLLPTQVVLGGLTVTRKLEPVIVTSHLATATLIIVCVSVATTATYYEG